jgi:nucleotide-binding universal stress UspA family protein
MSAHEPEVAYPGTDALAAGDGPSIRRVLVPVRSPGHAAEALGVAARVCRDTNAVLRLVHVRAYDPPMPRCPGRFYPESVADAEAVLDEALVAVWRGGARASTAVVDAPRGDEADAIARYASAWHADVIVLTRRPKSVVVRMLSGSVPDQVMRKANCPVLAVHPGRK